MNSLRRDYFLLHCTAIGSGSPSGHRVFLPQSESLPRVFLFVWGHLSAGRPVQGITWPAFQDRPPIGTTAHSLKEDNGALDEPEPRARQALSDVPMHAAHERSYPAGVVRE